MCINTDKNTWVWFTGYTEILFYLYIQSDGFFLYTRVFFTFDKHFWMETAGTVCDRAGQIQDQGRSVRLLTAFLHWVNQSKKQTQTWCLKKQYAFELLSIFQNKSRVLLWIFKEHRAISVSCSSVDSKLGHFFMTLNATLSQVLDSGVLRMWVSVLVCLFLLQCCLRVKVGVASICYHSVNNCGP